MSRQREKVGREISERKRGKEKKKGETQRLAEG